MFSLESKPFKQTQTVLLTSLKLFYYLLRRFFFILQVPLPVTDRTDVIVMMEVQTFVQVHVVMR